MTPAISVQQIVDELARDPLRNIVLLKHVLAYPEHSKIHRVSDETGAATTVMVDASVTSYDRQAYPRAAFAALISSDHPDLTAQLMRHVPRGVGIVFKLSRDADLAAVEAEFAVEPRTAVVSFTSTGPFEPSPRVRVTTEPGDAAFRLFESQGHDRGWLEPRLRNGTAFACALEHGGETPSACFAFENYGPVWEVGGVITAPSHRGRGFGADVVRTVLAELTGRGLTPRYQVETDNAASIALAQSAGLTRFLTVAHYAHEC